MGLKHFKSQNCSLFIVKFKKVGFSTPLMAVDDVLTLVATLFSKKQLLQFLEKMTYRLLLQ